MLCMCFVSPLKNWFLHPLVARSSPEIKHTQEKGHHIVSEKKQLEKLNEQLPATEQVTPQLQQDLMRKEKVVPKLQPENQHLRQEFDKVSQHSLVAPKAKLALKWTTCKAAPCKMHYGSATEFGREAYFRHAFSGQVWSYNSDMQKWSALPECHRKDFTLTVVDGLVTAVGGVQSGNHINTLLSLKKEGGKWKWVDYFRPMRTKRSLTAVVCSGRALVVAGGEGEWCKTLATVEVMDTDTFKWSTASSLPQPLSDASATVCGDRIYLVCGRDEIGFQTKLVFTCSLSTLLKSQTTLLKSQTVDSVWHKIAELPVERSTCVTLNGQLLAVGGRDADRKTNNNIYSYNTETNSWEIISQMPTARYWCLAAVLPGNRLIVVGGENDYTGYTDKVEIATCRELLLPIPQIDFFL